MKILKWLALHFAKFTDNRDDRLSYLILAAKEDAGLRHQLTQTLRMPTAQRAEAINSAVQRMEIDRRPAPIREAFLLLINDEVAARVLRKINER